jgi:hypothetical protein
VIALIIILSIKSRTTIPAAIPTETSSAVLVIKYVYKKTRPSRQRPIKVAAVP